jgi:glutamate-1-semialdehyde 2,1-aminomutase
MVIATEPATQVTTGEISRRYIEAFAASKQLAHAAQQVFPSGVTHDGRYLQPFPVFIDRAAGSRKVSVEGHSIIDYWVGHGSLLLGHSHPRVVSAVQEQMALGTHFSACHRGEIAWGERVQRLVPSAEQVRFTNSGTEATLMALRISRLVTGRSKVVKFIGHFHGWHDFLVPAAYAPYVEGDLSTPGVPPGVLSDLVAIPPNDLASVERALVEHQPACLILEGTGGHWGTVPMRRDFVRGVRELTQRHGVFMIMDEVITGFRVHPGGAQAEFGIVPDMTTLAKILAGGLPGGALAGRRDLLDAVAFNNRYGKKMNHPGTYNGNPLSAAAGCAALDVIAQENSCAKANEFARALRQRLNQLFVEKQANWIAYGDYSTIRILPKYDGPASTSDDFIPCGNDYRRLDAKDDKQFLYAFRAALLLGGVDWFGWGGLTSAAHTQADLQQTITAFSDAIDLLRQDGWLP